MSFGPPRVLLVRTSTGVKPVCLRVVRKEPPARPLQPPMMLGPPPLRPAPNFVLQGNNVTINVQEQRQPVAVTTAPPIVNYSDNMQNGVCWNDNSQFIAPSLADGYSGPSTSCVATSGTPVNVRRTFKRTRRAVRSKSNANSVPEHQSSKNVENDNNPELFVFNGGEPYQDVVYEEAVASTAVDSNSPYCLESFNDVSLTDESGEIETIFENNTAQSNIFRNSVKDYDPVMIPLVPGQTFTSVKNLRIHQHDRPVKRRRRLCRKKSKKSVQETEEANDSAEICINDTPVIVEDVDVTPVEDTSVSVADVQDIIDSVCTAVSIEKNTPACKKPKNISSNEKCELILQTVAKNMSDKNQESAEEVLDPFNLSNDKYYSPLVQGYVSDNIILHSLPAQDLSPVLFPTYYTEAQLRNFHRLPLRFPTKQLQNLRFESIHSLKDRIEEVFEAREQARLDSGGGAMFFMRTINDLSGKDGDLILCEYCEEHPPLLMQPGMATKVKNLYKKIPGQSENDIETNFEYGETTCSNFSPFLADLGPGEMMQMLENKLFRAPIFWHDFPETDFLIIKDSEGFFIRSINNIYCVGQECPLVSVPHPTSIQVTNFIREIIQVYIYRLFWKSQHQPRRLKSDSLRTAFPYYAESSLRKRLKRSSVFTRLGQGANWNYWLLNDDFRLPSMEEIRAMVTPEMYCAHFSMLAAEQRLKDAGYSNGFCFNVLEEEEEEDEDGSANHPKLEREVQCAPWNTTRAYILASQGKCLLDLVGAADPTGRGEGFSYCKLSKKVQSPIVLAEERIVKPKEDESFVAEQCAASVKLRKPSKSRGIIGTDADLRKLSLAAAREMLKDFGVKDSDIEALQRWEVINVIRSFSTQQAKAGNSSLTKFARGSLKFSMNDLKDQFRTEYQRIFDLQNRSLSCAEYMSTDEEDYEDDDEQESSVLPEPVDRAKPVESGVCNAQQSRVLKIYRTYRTIDGHAYVNIETIDRPALIDAYLKVRSSKDEEFISRFAVTDKDYKKQMYKVKRRLQDKLRRVKRNQIRAQLGLPLGRSVRVIRAPPKPIKASLLRMRCSACGGTGHMKTNKHCPFYKQNVAEIESNAIRQECYDEEYANNVSLDRTVADDSDIDSYVSIQGTKLSIRKTALRQYPKSVKYDSDEYVTDYSDDEMLPEEAEHEEEENRQQQQEQSTSAFVVKQEEDYSPSSSWKRTVKRRRTDPKVELCLILEKIVNELKATNVADPFLKKVSSKSYRDYYSIVKKPMDLCTIKINLSKNQYSSQTQLLADINQILTNSRLYNGDDHVVTMAAKRLVEITMEKLHTHRRELQDLESLIDPLLGNDNFTLFCVELRRIVEKCKQVKRVTKLTVSTHPKKYVAYCSKISEPMDLNILERKCCSKQYTNVGQFLSDVKKIYSNSVIHNGPTSFYTMKAKEIVDLANSLISQNSERLAFLETNLSDVSLKDESFFKADINVSSAGDDVPLDIPSDSVDQATFTVRMSRRTKPLVMESCGEMSEMDKRIGNFLPDDNRSAISISGDEILSLKHIKEENDDSPNVGGNDFVQPYLAPKAEDGKLKRKRGRPLGSFKRGR